MAKNDESKRDHWSSEAYKSAAGFVPKLTSTVVSYLDPQPNDNILDIGCGDGQLTEQIAHQLSGKGQILGLDASLSFIKTAAAEHKPNNVRYRHQDCTKLMEDQEVQTAKFNKVFSNAALHWILRNPETRVEVFRDMHTALEPGGKLVFEMGGKGNVTEVHVAFIAALVAQGVSLDAAREASPWFFPSVEWMSKTLTDVGFDVEKCELEYRPTKCTADGQGGGLDGWLRLMGAQFLEAVSADKRDEVVRSVCDMLETVITREEDGSKWLGYVRLRAVARKR